jgi:hypothetical protein
VRLIAYCGIYQFLKQGTSIESFMPLPSDDKKEMQIDKVKELMERVRESHKKKYNLS